MVYWIVPQIYMDGLTERLVSLLDDPGPEVRGQSQEWRVRSVRIPAFAGIRNSK